MTQSANQTAGQIQQDVNQTSEANKVNANYSGSNSTDITKNIRKNLTEVAKKLDEAFSKTLPVLTK